jgi:predicted Zn-ribbon and HTH transcriptional regulator
MSKCPGQDTQQWKWDAIFDVKCQSCGYMVEFFKDETKRKCPKCKEVVLNDRIDLGCAKWCPYAESCLGPEQYKTFELSEKLAKRREDLTLLLEAVGEENEDVRELFKKLYSENEDNDVLFDTKRLYALKGAEDELFDKATSAFNRFLEEKKAHDEKTQASRRRTEEMISHFKKQPAADSKGG